MNLDVNQYDLNELFRFDLLKNILTNITNEQKKLSEDIESLKESNKNRDEKIAKIEKMSILKQLGLEEELNEDDNKNVVDIKNIENKNNKTFLQSKEELNEKINNADNKNINNNNEENQNDSSKTKDIKTINNSNEEEANIRKNNIKNKIKGISLSKHNNNEQLSKNSVLLFMREIHSLEEKINNLENKLMMKFKYQYKKIEEDSEKNILSISEEYKMIYEKLEQQINELLKNKEEQNRKLENCLLKCDSIDIYNLLKDNGDGTIDATKLMVNTLEEKVFKKIGFIEERYKKESEDVIKLIKSDERNSINIDKMQKNMVDLKYNELSQIREIFKQNLNERDMKIQEIKNSMNDQEMDFSQKMNELENNLIGILNEKEDIINKNIENINKVEDNLTKIENEINKSNIKQNNIIQELTNDFDRKINIYKNKINNIENIIKSISDSFNPKEIKEDINEIKSDLKEKITKEYLKELYNLNLNNTEDINNTRKTILTLQEEIRKVTSDVDNIAPKVNSFMNYIIQKKQKKKESKKTEIDFEQFVLKQKYEEGKNYFTRKIDNIFIEIESMRRDFEDIKIEQNFFEKKEVVLKIEEDFHSLLEENKSKIQKNKNELHKQIRGLEIEIKSLWAEFKKRESADSWILAKQPIKCFNCATCDNDIKIESQKEEYIPWNKILPNNRSYRIGKGFSHMLEKMSSDLINNLDENSESKDNTIGNSDKNVKNVSNNNVVNSSVQIDENKFNINDKNNHMFDNIAQIERSGSQSQMNFPRAKNSRIINSVRVRLPQVVDMAKKKAIFETFKNINSLSDREKVIINGYLPKNQSFIDSPKIIKIKKKEKENSKKISFIPPSKEGLFQ